MPAFLQDVFLQDVLVACSWVYFHLRPLIVSPLFLLNLCEVPYYSYTPCTPLYITYPPIHHASYFTAIPKKHWKGVSTTVHIYIVFTRQCIHILSRVPMLAC